MPEHEATQRLAEILARISKLPGENLEPPQFFANYLQLAIAATGSQGGAIWVLQGEQGPQCYCHVNMELCLINEPDQQRLIIKAVGRTKDEGKSLVVPGANGDIGEGTEEGSSNQCPHPLFFKPLKAANQVAMVVQMVGAQGLDPQEFRVVVGLLDQIGETGETYLAHRRAAVLEDDRKALTQLLQYSEGVHDTLDPEKVVNLISNLGRDAIGCDRVVTWIDPKIKRGLRSVSGIDKPDRRAVLMQSLEKMSKHCLEIKKPIIASRGQLVELPEEEKLTGLLKNYFNVSQLDQIFLQPIQHEETYLGVLIAEGFDETSATNLAGVIGSVSKHGGVALHNALEMASVPMVRPLARLKKIKEDPHKRRKWLIRGGLVLLGLIVLLLMPWTVKIETACELVPQQMRMIESPLQGVQIKRIVRSSGIVKKNEIIAELDDLDMRTKLVSLQRELEQEEINNDQVIGKAGREISDLEIAKLKNDIAFFEYQIEKCMVRSPIAGTILTDRLDRKEGLTLSKGDLICEVGDLNKWQLVLDVPQEEINWVQRGLEGDKKAKVQFFLNAYPQHKLSTEVLNVEQIGQIARIKEKGNVFEVRMNVSAEQLAQITSGLRSGMVGRAKISTVSRPIGYVMLRKVIRFFRVTFF